MSNINLSETAPTRFQDTGGVGLAYRHFGKEGAAPVVCFQHFTGTMNNFDPIHTNRLAQDRPVILVDYRGVGRSGGKMLDSMPAIAADLIAFVKALGLKEIDLFAFSIGGMIGQQFVLDAPELVRRVLLVGTGPSGGEGMQHFSSEVMDIVNRPNSTIQGRTLDLFFSRSPAGNRPAKAGLSGTAPERRRARQKRHDGAHHQFLYPSAAPAGCPIDPLPGFRARLSLPVSRSVCRRGRPL